MGLREASAGPGQPQQVWTRIKQGPGGHRQSRVGSELPPVFQRKVGSRHNQPLEYIEEIYLEQEI